MIAEHDADHDAEDNTEDHVHQIMIMSTTMHRIICFDFLNDFTYLQLINYSFLLLHTVWQFFNINYLVTVSK